MVAITNKFLRMYYRTIFAACLIIGYIFYFISNTTTSTAGYTAFSRPWIVGKAPAILATMSESQISKGYASKINGSDQYRLGFATQLDTRFQKLPKSWEYMLSETKRGKISNTENGEKNIVSNHSDFKNSQKQITTKVMMMTTPQSQLATKLIKPKKIFLYHPPSWLYVNSKNSPRNKNSEYECEYIDWKSSEPETIQMETVARDADAIVVHNSNTLSTKILDSIYFESIKMSKAEVKDGPKLIHFTLESPSYDFNSFDMRIQGNNRARDLLASYWRGSDIYTPYYRWQSLNTTTNQSKIPDKNYAEGRTKMAAIVVSNCNTPNNRMQLVRELQKFITVDVFGACGTLTCSQTHCFESIGKNYKFYLAFENSNCRDYITEKFYRNAYSNDLLPIVLGAHPSDYKAVAPPNSYIHVEDFESVESLGRYLQQLHHNDTLYNSYFKWKGSGNFNSENCILCEMCAYLHTQDLTVAGENERGSEFEIPVNVSTNNGMKETMMPYFNTNDGYDFNIFHWSTQDDRLCLKNNQWYWNR